MTHRKSDINDTINYIVYIIYVKIITTRINTILLYDIYFNKLIKFIYSVKIFIIYIFKFNIICYTFYVIIKLFYINFYYYA